MSLLWQNNIPVECEKINVKELYKSVSYEIENGNIVDIKWKMVKRKKEGNMMENEEEKIEKHITRKQRSECSQFGVFVLENINA